jgi:hypothetical protein
MTSITFRTHDAFVIFQNMADGMWCNARDDGDVQRQLALDSVIHGLNHEWMRSNEAPCYPVKLPLKGDIEMARAVLENCLSDDDADDENFIGIGNCTID